MSCRATKIELLPIFFPTSNFLHFFFLDSNYLATDFWCSLRISNLLSENGGGAIGIWNSVEFSRGENIAFAFNERLDNHQAFKSQYKNSKQSNRQTKPLLNPSPASEKSMHFSLRIEKRTAVDLIYTVMDSIITVGVSIFWCLLLTVVRIMDHSPAGFLSFSFFNSITLTAHFSLFSQRFNVCVNSTLVFGTHAAIQRTPLRCARSKKVIKKKWWRKA